jgi:hypothetical protein
MVLQPKLRSHTATFLTRDRAGAGGGWTVVGEEFAVSTVDEDLPESGLSMEKMEGCCWRSTCRLRNLRTPSPGPQLCTRGEGS